MSLDELGAVSAIEFREPVAPKLERALRDRISGWRFSPVLVEGEPGPATVNLSITLGFTETGETFQARVIRAATGLKTLSMSVPKYPRSELRAQRGGTVVLKLVVDTDGSVADAIPVYATNAKFSRAAIRAAMHYRFEPLLVDGVPARAEIYIPARFYINGRIPELPEIPELRGSELETGSGALTAELGGQLLTEVQGAL
ncbi:MAG: energy transducer TonB [Xanthomonadales bacterium]|nr:energy transducer TonB [Xanthomonadales bacterium]